MEEKEGVNPAGMASAARRVLVVDDSVLVRQGLRAILECSSDLSVIGEAENGIRAVSMAAHIRPVIGFSVNDDPHVQAAMREAGADAFLQKEAASTHICDAIAALAHQRRVERIDQER
jgi:DNA-binding NarL/FixJ family response regulator